MSTTINLGLEYDEITDQMLDALINKQYVVSVGLYGVKIGVNVDGEVELVGYIGPLDEAKVKEVIAKSLKTLVKKTCSVDWQHEGRQSKEVVKQLSGNGIDVQVRDVYRIYDILKGRVHPEGNRFHIPTRQRVYAKNLMVGDKLDGCGEIKHIDQFNDPKFGDIIVVTYTPNGYGTVSINYKPDDIVSILQ
jgi:hypothetical protein